jgi:YtoQ family protein
VHTTFHHEDSDFKSGVLDGATRSQARVLLVIRREDLECLPFRCPFSDCLNERNRALTLTFTTGEIHTDWRQIIEDGVTHLPIRLTSSNTSHEDSDDCGAIILGMAKERPVWDSLGARMNQIRTSTLIREADVVVVRFGDEYRQWNAAFDAGFAAAMQKPLITVHPPSLGHMLKEVNAAANVVCHEPKQVVQTLEYVITGKLPSPKDGDKYVPIAERLGKGNPNP